MVMDRENLTPSAFADQLGIGRAVVSHILNGRNNPSLEVVTKILETFKDINPSWLLFGEGEISDDGPQTQNSNHTTLYGDLFGDENHWSGSKQEDVSVIRSEKAEKSTDVRSTSMHVPFEEAKIPMKSKQISKIIIYYDDNSFQIFDPSKTSL